MSTEKLPSLWQVEAELAAWIDTEEGGTVPAELQAEFAAGIAEASERGAAKRGNVIRFIQVAEAEMALCKVEEERIRDRRKQIEAGLERFRAYVAGVVQEFGTQKPGQTSKTLPCALGILRAQHGPAKVVITDDEAVPFDFKRATVHFDNAADWHWIVNVLATSGDEPAPTGTWRATFTPDKDRIKEAQDAGEEVPGADRQMEGDLFLKLK